MIASLPAAAAWAALYANPHAHARSAISRWYDLHLDWLQNMAGLVSPRRRRAFLRASLAAVPVNIAATLIASFAVTAVTYVHLGGSDPRDRVFIRVFVALNAPLLLAYFRLTYRKTPL